MSNSEKWLHQKNNLAKLDRALAWAEKKPIDNFALLSKKIENGKNKKTAKVARFSKRKNKRGGYVICRPALEKVSGTPLLNFSNLFQSIPPSGKAKSLRISRSKRLIVLAHSLSNSIL